MTHQLIDENDGRAVLLRLLECLPQVGLWLSGQLGHDLRTVDQEEEGAGLVGDSAGKEGLAGAGGAVQLEADKGKIIKYVFLGRKNFYYSRDTLSWPKK